MRVLLFKIYKSRSALVRFKRVSVALIHARATDTFSLLFLCWLGRRRFHRFFLLGAALRLHCRRRARNAPARVGSDEMKRVDAAVQNFAVDEKDVSAPNLREITENFRFRRVHVL